jgi:hypothetical protein
MEAKLTAIQAMYLDSVEHTTEIMETTEAHVVLVELK